MIVSAPPRAWRPAPRRRRGPWRCGDVAREPHAARRWRRCRSLSPTLRAVEVEPVAAGLALDDVVAVAGVPLEAVVAGAEERAVDALVAVDRVVAGAAEQEVGAVAAAQVSFVGAAVDRQRRERREVADGRERVLAGEAETTRLSTAVVSSRPASGENVLTSVPFGTRRSSSASRAAVAGDVGAVAAVDVVRGRAEDLRPVLIVSSPPSVATFTSSFADSTPSTMHLRAPGPETIG